MIYDILQVIGVVIFFSLYGYLHSWLAMDKTKRMIAAKAGDLMAFYRLAYNLLALLILFLFLEFWPKSRTSVYELVYPWDFIMLLFQLFSLAGLVYILKYFNVWEFIGIAQIRRFFHDEYKPEQLDEVYNLKIRGPYRVMRHPAYFFFIGVLIFRPHMDLFYFIFVVSLIAYFYVGSYFEEEKLIERFGERYTRYRKEVPRMFPYKLHKPYPID